MFVGKGVVYCKYLSVKIKQLNGDRSKVTVEYSPMKMNVIIVYIHPTIDALNSYDSYGIGITKKCFSPVKFGGNVLLTSNVLISQKKVYRSCRK